MESATHKMACIAEWKGTCCCYIGGVRKERAPWEGRLSEERAKRGRMMMKGKEGEGKTSRGNPE